ncbi:MAG: M48 family metallopeptidase [Myxococcota bacterium]
MTEPSFRSYVERRERETHGGTDERTRYAYGPDLKMLRAFRRMRPLEAGVGEIVRRYEGVLRNQFLGTTVRVGPKQLPGLHALAKSCAETLDVPLPTLYVVNDPRMNAFTFGTDKEAFIVLHSQLIDHMDETELKFVIGHEMGHVQNKHVVYGTALQILRSPVAVLSAVLRLLLPIDAALRGALLAWARNAEITCDRAGLLCCGDLDAATRSFLKIACGSTKLYAELDVDAYLEQLEDGRKGVGRLGELGASHPYLPKRIQALRLFAESAYYQRALGESEEGIADMVEVDRQVAEILRIVRKPTEAPAALAAVDDAGGAETVEQTETQGEEA